MRRRNFSPCRNAKPLTLVHACGHERYVHEADTAARRSRKRAAKRILCPACVREQGRRDLNPTSPDEEAEYAALLESLEARRAA